MWESTLNRLVLLQPPSFIYEARPAAAGQSRRGLGGGRLAARRGSGAGAGLGGEDDGEEEDGLAVFGCYAAVSLCDCGVLHALQSSLGPLLSDRSWQSGGYSAEVVSPY
jgi:hypothetical protein